MVDHFELYLSVSLSLSTIQFDTLVKRLVPGVKSSVRNGASAAQNGLLVGTWDILSGFHGKLPLQTTTVIYG